MALEQYPETDTLIASISRVKEDHELVAEAKKLGLNFIVGNPHSVEIFENGLPLAYALERMLPGLEIYLMRERVTATPLQCAALPNILQYGKAMADTYLVPEEYTDARKEMKKGKAAVVKTTQ